MKKKVLFTIPNFNTAGSGKALLNLAKGLNPEKFEAHILCQNASGTFFETVKNSGLPVHVFNYLPTSRPLFKMVTESWKVSSQFKKINPAIIHSFHYSDNYTEGIAARLSGAKWVFTKKNMSWGGGNGNGWKLRSALANAIAVQNTDMIKELYPNSTKTTLIPRGVNIQQFTPQPPRPEIKSQMNTPEVARIIICVANMVPVKGVELLMEAFNNLSSEFPNWHLWLVGDINNDYGRELVGRAKLISSAAKIHFSGKQSNVGEYLDHAEIFVLPTKDEGRREGSPVALLEAMANGKVVLGSKVPGIKDQLESFPQHLFEAGNTESLQQVLKNMLEMPNEDLKLLGLKFQNHVTKNYSLELEVKRHEEFYLKALSK